MSKTIDHDAARTGYDEALLPDALSSYYQTQ